MVKKYKKMSKDKLCIIVVPVYKENMDKFEELAFRQCLKVLHKYRICLVTHEHLNLSVYKKLAKEYSIQLEMKFFSEPYFTGIPGYNKLLKNKQFYLSFSSYEYILIYHLDAFVFRDELEYWCHQGYDYIGAPWVTNINEELMDISLWKVGNGGLSLRRISFFLKVLSWKGPLLKYSEYKNIFYLPYMLGWRNNIKYFLKLELNEDIFFTSFLTHTYIKPKLPSPSKAAFFAFEKSPSYLFKLCKEHLPFGCHAFMKFEYESFWKKYIK